MLLELVETERDYVRDLGLIVEVSGLFLPHSRLEFFPPETWNDAFSIGTVNYQHSLLLIGSDYCHTVCKVICTEFENTSFVKQQAVVWFVDAVKNNSV